MKLLCIGQSGQVASALAARAAARGVDCFCLGRPEIDIRDISLIQRAVESVAPTLIINAAAYTSVDAAESNEVAAFAANADGARNVAEVCAQHGLPIIHLSTDYIFDGTLDRPYREDDQPAPLNVYGASKLAGEIAVREANARHIILRTSWVYGPFGSNFVKTMLRLAKTRSEVSVVDDQIGRPTNCLDIAETVIDIAKGLVERSDENLFGTYHYATHGDCSWADLAARVFDSYEHRTGCKITLNRIPTSEYPTPADRPLNSRLDTRKIEQAFGVMPTHWTTHVQSIVNRLIDEGI